MNTYFSHPGVFCSGVSALSPSLSSLSLTLDSTSGLNLRFDLRFELAIEAEVASIAPLASVQLHQASILNWVTQYWWLSSSTL